MSRELFDNTQLQSLSASPTQAASDGSDADPRSPRSADCADDIKCDQMQDDRYMIPATPFIAHHAYDNSYETGGHDSASFGYVRQNPQDGNIRVPSMHRNQNETHQAFPAPMHLVPAPLYLQPSHQAHFQMHMPMQAYQSVQMHYHAVPAPQRFVHYSPAVQQANVPFRSSMVWTLPASGTSQSCSVTEHVPHQSGNLSQGMETSNSLESANNKFDAAQSSTALKKLDKSSAPQSSNVGLTTAAGSGAQTLGTSKVSVASARNARERRKKHLAEVRSRSRTFQASATALVAVEIAQQTSSSSSPTLAPISKTHTGTEEADAERRRARRVRNRASVEKCRTRQKERIARLEDEQANLTRETPILLRALEHLNRCGVLGLLLFRSPVELFAALDAAPDAASAEASIGRALPDKPGGADENVEGSL